MSQVNRGLIVLLLGRIWILSHDIKSVSDIMPCNKIDKSLVVYRFSNEHIDVYYNVAKLWQNLNVFTPKL